MSSWTRWIVLFALLDFSALTCYALYMEGLSGMIEVATGSVMGVTLAVDLCIALALACAWIWKDAKARGKSGLPFVVLTLCTGSVGPLLYLWMRPVKASAPKLATSHA